MAKNAAILHGFPAGRACRLASLSPNMLDYLTRERYISASGSTRRGRGHKRLFTFGDIVTLRIIAQLLRSGIEIRRLRRGLRALRKRVGDAQPENLPFRFLVTDGTEVFLHDVKSFESLTRNGQLAFAFLIDLHRFNIDIQLDDSNKTIPPKRRKRS